MPAPPPGKVADLVARGLTNRQIADERFASDRTIESHVANVLGKLGLDNRVQLVAWVAASGEPGAGRTQAPVVAPIAPGGRRMGGRMMVNRGAFVRAT